MQLKMGYSFQMGKDILKHWINKTIMMMGMKSLEMILTTMTMDMILGQNLRIIGVQYRQYWINVVFGPKARG